MDNKGVSLTIEEGLWLLVKIGFFLMMIVTFGFMLLSPEGECEKLDRRPRDCIENPRCRPTVGVENPSTFWFVTGGYRTHVAYSGCTRAVRMPNHELNCNDEGYACEDWDWSWSPGFARVGVNDDDNWECIDDEENPYYGACVHNSVDILEVDDGWSYTLPPNTDI